MKNPVFKLYSLQVRTATEMEMQGEEVAQRSQHVLVVKEDGLVGSGPVRSRHVSWYDIRHSLPEMLKKANQSFYHFHGSLRITKPTSREVGTTN